MSRLSLTLAAVLVAATTSLAGAQPGTISGTVLTAGRLPAADARVTLVELRREVAVDDDGRFSFSGVPAGSYLLSALSLRSGAALAEVAVAPGAAVEVVIALDQRVHGDAITVTATGEARGLDQEVRPVNVLTGDELKIQREATLGDTLGKQAGVVSSTYGRGSTRPLIRGLGGDRVRILSNGLDAADVSSIGPDHAVALDPLAAERIEVLRGPGTLLYGANALGGVVNVLDTSIPDRPASSPLSGQVELLGGTVADEYGGSARLDGGGGSWAWHLDLFARRSDDYSSPAPHRVGGGHHEEDEDHHEEDHDHEDEEYETGTVENTFTDSEGGTFGLSWVGDRGFLGLSAGAFDSQYGIPGHGHHHDEEHDDETIARLRPALAADGEEHDEEPAVFTDLSQRRLDLHGRIDRPFEGLRALSLRAGWRDYEHREMEGEEIGTRFTNDFTEARLDALLAPIGPFTGTAGASWLDRDFAAAGEEAFVLPTTTRRSALYLFQEMPAEPVGVQLGLRWENQDTASSDPLLPDRAFDGLSGSLGVSWKPAEGWLAGLSWTRSERAPTAEELYSDGPHAATRAYEIGDPNLDQEIGDALDLTVRASFERVDAELSVFRTDFSDFIYLRETGEVEDDLDVLVFTQTDARFTGFEVHAHVELLHSEPHHLHLGVTYDQVRADLVDTGENLPRIPPRRARVALVYQGGSLYGEGAVRWVDGQDRVGAFEEPTDSYTMLDLSVGYRLFAGKVVHDLLLKGTNLTDEAAYDHTSFLKLEAPLPGRNLGLVYRVIF